VTACLQTGQAIENIILLYHEVTNALTMGFGKQRFEVDDAAAGAGEILFRSRSHVLYMKNRVTTAVFAKHSQRVGSAAWCLTIPA